MSLDVVVGPQEGVDTKEDTIGTTLPRGPSVAIAMISSSFVHCSPDGSRSFGAFGKTFGVTHYTASKFYSV